MTNNSDDAIDNEQTKSIPLKHKKINSKKDLYTPFHPSHFLARGDLFKELYLE